jgi:hypothetical protein
MAGTLAHGFTRSGRWLRKELIALWPVFLFFLVSFLILILLFKIALGEFSIKVSVISNAVIGALLAGKAALILDETPLAHRLEQNRGIVAVACKALFYGLTAFLFLYVERVLDGLHKFGNLDAAVQHVSPYGVRWILIWALGITIVFALYFSFVEISRRLGEGELWKLFFEPPKPVYDSGRNTNMNVSKQRS